MPAARGQVLAFVVMLALWMQGFAGGAAVAAQATASVPTVVMTHAQQIASGIGISSIGAMSYVRSATAYGRVLDPQRLGALRDRLNTALLRQHDASVAWSTAQQAAQRLDPSSSRHGDAASPRARAAQAREARARARLDAANAAMQAAERAARAQWGDTLAAEALEGSPEFDALASGQASLVDLTVPEGLGGTSAPALLRLRLLDGSGKSTLGRLLSPSPRLLPPTPGTGFFYVVAVANLRPGLRVLAQLPLSDKHVEGVRIPKAAVLWIKKRAWAYVQVGPERFVRRPVPTERPVPGGWFAAHGWQAGQRVVVRGAAALRAREAGSAAGPARAAPALK